MTPRALRAVCLSTVTVVTVAMTAAAGTARAADGVVLLPLRSESLPRSTSNALDDLLAVALADQSQLAVVTKNEIEAQLEREELKDLLECDALTCAAEIGGALGTRYLLTGAVRKLGDNVIVTLSLIDTESQTVIRGQAKREDDVNRYDLLITDAVSNLLERSETLARRPADGACSGANQWRQRFTLPGSADRFQDTGILIPAGTSFETVATGIFHPCAGCWADKPGGYSPGGALVGDPVASTPRRDKHDGEMSLSAPAKDLPTFALVGRIGNEPPFLIGTGVSLPPKPTGGYLEVAFNDWFFPDNTGGATLEIQGCYPPGAPDRSTSGRSDCPSDREVQHGYTLVAGADRFQETGIVIPPNAIVTVRASGAYHPCSGCWADKPGGYSPDGARVGDPVALTPRQDKHDGDLALNAPAPDLPSLALVGRVRSDPPFLIGSGVTLPPRYSGGPLEVALNDWYFPDNTGSILVRVQICHPPKSRY